MSRPQELADAEAPQYRYWGSRKPPKNKSDFFAVDTTPASSTGTAAGSIATIRMYGPIDSWGGYWGVSADDISDALDALDPTVTEIRLRINSPGGEVFEALTILNLLRAHPATVVAVVDGLAASAAGVIAAGCDETVMSPGTQLMIHDARCYVYGPPDRLRKVAEILDSLSDGTAEVFVEAAGGTVAAWRDLMIEETWYAASEAVAAGLADRVGVVLDTGQATPAEDTDNDVLIVVPLEDAEARATERFAAFDLSMYAYAGRRGAPAPRAHNSAPQPPSASAVGSTTTQGTETAMAFTPEQLTTMRQELGLTEDADEATIVAALSEALAEQAAEPTAAATTTVPAGHRLVPDVTYDELQANARAGAAAAEQLRVQERERFLNEHRDRFLPVNRDAYRAQYDTNPQGTREYLATAPAIVPTELIGHEVASEATATDDSWFPGYSAPAGQEK